MKKSLPLLLLLFSYGALVPLASARKTTQQIKPLIWTATIPAAPGGYQTGHPYIPPGPFSHFHLDHGITLLQLGYDTYVQPTCGGVAVLNPKTFAYFDIQFSSLGPAFGGDPGAFFTGTNNLRGKGAHFAAGTDLWIILDNYVDCSATPFPEGTFTLEYLVDN